MSCSPNFSMTLETEIFSTETSDFLTQMIFLKPFNSVLCVFGLFYVLPAPSRRETQLFLFQTCRQRWLRRKLYSGFSGLALFSENVQTGEALHSQKFLFCQDIAYRNPKLQMKIEHFVSLMNDQLHLTINCIYAHENT